MPNDNLPPESANLHADEPTFTYDREIGPGYFVQVRSDFLRDGSIPPLARLLYSIFLTHAGAGESTYPGQERLAEELGVTGKTLRNMIGELEQLGLVKVTRRGQGLTNRYHIHKLELIRRGQAVPERENLPFQNGSSERSLRPLQKGKNSHSGAVVFTAKLESGDSQKDKLQGTLLTHENSGHDEAEQSNTTQDEGEFPAVKAPPYSPWIAAVISDYSREFNDLANSAASVDRALRIWQRSGIGESVFVDVLQRAKLELRKAQARGVAHKMQRFFVAAEDIIANGGN